MSEISDLSRHIIIGELIRKVPDDFPASPIDLFVYLIHGIIIVKIPPLGERKCCTAVLKHVRK